MLSTSTPGASRRVRLHRRMAGVALLTGALLAGFGASAVAAQRRVDRALEDLMRHTELRSDVSHLQVRFVEAREQIHLVLDALPIDIATLSGSGELSIDAIQDLPGGWADIVRSRPGALPPMRGLLDVDDAVITSIISTPDPGAPEVLRFRADIDQRLTERQRQLDGFAETLTGDVADGFEGVREASARKHRATLTIAGGGAGILLALMALMARTALRLHRQAAEEDRLRKLTAQRTQQEREIQNGLDMAPSEDGALQVVERAITEHTPGVRVDVLLADSSRSHFGRALTVGDDIAPGCLVATPEACPALSRGHRVDFGDSRAIDACPHLPATDDPTRATCIPMSIAGSSAGVLHIAAPVEQEIGDLEVLETMARSASDRIGVLRAFARSEAQAATDPLTGLLNRRSLEDRARRQLDLGGRCAVAFGDLDHFKHLNDIHGHETGDRALRLFARVLSEEVRPGDLVCRFGGEEFVVLLADCDAPDALNVLHRVHTRLANEVAASGVPPFTVSFGVAEWDGDLGMADLVARADVALLQAKRDGRDCDRTFGQTVAAEPA